MWALVLVLVVLVASTFFRAWARLALGTMWSLKSTVKDDQQLRTHGPYAVTRRPIHTGLLGMLLGTTLRNGIGQWIVIFPVGLILMEIKIREDDRLIRATFPAEYPRYRQQVPQIPPVFPKCNDTTPSTDGENWGKTARTSEPALRPDPRVAQPSRPSRRYGCEDGHREVIRPVTRALLYFAQWWCGFRSV